MSEALLTVVELADRIKLDPQTIYRKVANREIPFLRAGKGRTGIRFNWLSIEKWMKESGK